MCSTTGEQIDTHEGDAKLVATSPHTSTVCMATYSGGAEIPASESAGFPVWWGSSIAWSA